MSGLYVCSAIPGRESEAILAKGMDAERVRVYDCTCTCMCTTVNAEILLVWLSVIYSHQYSLNACMIISYITSSI